MKRHRHEVEALKDNVFEHILASSVGKMSNKQIICRVYTRNNHVEYVVKDISGEVICYTIKDAVELYNSLP